MGVVLQVEHVRSARPVALKFLPEDFLKKDPYGTSIELSEGLGDGLGCAVDTLSHRAFLTESRNIRRR